MPSGTLSPSPQSSSKLAPPKSLPAPLRMLFRPILLGAIGLHALLLFTPFPQEQKPKAPDDKKNPVKISQIPTAKSNQPVPAKARPRTTATRSTLPKINRPSTAPALPRVASTAPVQPQAPASPAQNSQAPTNTKDPFQDFPHFSPSSPDCFGLGLGENCRVTNAGLAAVAAHYQKALPDKKYSVSSDVSDSSKQIFQVTKDGVTRYLHLFVDRPTTVILLSPERIADLQTLKGAVVPPEDYYTLLGTVIPESGRGDNEPSTAAQYEQFDKPEFFFKPISNEELQRGNIPELLPGIDGTPKISPDQSPKALYSTFLEPELKTVFREVALEGQYGGGDLYRLKSDKVTIYLNVIPYKGGEGSILITWLKNPRGS